MTLTDLPVIFHRTERKHRTGDTIRRLRRQVAELEARQKAADRFFESLLIDRQHVYDAWQFAEQKRQEAEQVAMCALEESAAMNRELIELRAFKANVNSVRPLPAPVPQAMPTQARFNQGPAVRLGASPMATTRPVPSWAKTGEPRLDDTQPVPVIGTGAQTEATSWRS